MDDLAAWLTQIWDEQEKVALDAAGWDRSGRRRASGQWVRSGISSIEDDERWSVIYDDSGKVSESVADHVARHDPASVLARIAADRQILALHRPNGRNILGYPVCDACTPLKPTPCPTVRLLALPHADRPGYREEWAVSL